MNPTQETKKKLFIAENRITHDRRLVIAKDAVDAYLQLGESTDDSTMEEVQKFWKKRKDKGFDYLVKIPTETCPYQYAACKRPFDTPCSYADDTPDLTEWLRVVSRAHLCAHVGEPLCKQDHALRQKWLTIDEAIKELTAKLP